MKRHPADLAVLGGPAEFARPLLVGTPNIGDRRRLRERLDRALDTRRLTHHGPYVQELERRLQRLTGARHCVAVSSGTGGLELTARALGLTGEVIVPSLTFVATAHALSWLGLTPVFCDVDPATHTLDPAAVRRLVGPRTSAVLGVHLWGRPCAVDELAAVAREHDLRLVYDAAHAFACSAGGRPVGGFGDAEVFSFHATKFVNAFEGGAVATDDDALADRLRAMRNFGRLDGDEVAYPGTNAKLTEPAAAMGLTSLEALDGIVAHNRRNYHAYRDGLAGTPGVRLLPFDEREACNYQYVVLEVDGALDRDTLLAVLVAENVHARAYFARGCHTMTPYAGGPALPHTEAVGARVLTLPTGTAVGAEEVARVAALIRFATDHAADLRGSAAAA